MDRKKYHVTKTDDSWKVKAEGNTKATSKHPTKSEAVGAAKDLAKGQKPSQVIVHKEDGSFQYENTYGNDPYPPRG